MTPGGYNTAPADPVILIMVAYLLLWKPCFYYFKPNRIRCT
jgi:hypothetical protein